MPHATQEKAKSYDFGQTVTILVGTFQTPFHLHPSKLSEKSEYFKARLSARWYNESKPITLPQFHPDTFHDYATWVYTGDVDLSKAASMVEDDSNEPCAFASLYHLADYVLDMPLRNLVVNKLIDAGRQRGLRPGIPTINATFGPNGGREDSTLCRLVLDNYLSGTDRGWLEDHLKALPWAFTQRLLLGWAEASSDSSVTYKNLTVAAKCKYHEHDDECPKTEACENEEASALLVELEERYEKPQKKASKVVKRSSGGRTRR